MTIALGDKCIDVITGYEGVVTGRCVYITGCEQVLLTGRVGDDNRKSDGAWFDIDRCDLIEAGVISIGLAAAVSTIGSTATGPDLPAPIK